MLSSRIVARAARVTVPKAHIAPIAIRSYAAANTKPPVALFGVDGTYASALVRLQCPPTEALLGSPNPCQMALSRS